jgi:hypothetical protein
MSSKIVAWELKLTWDDGTVNDVSNYVPSHTSGAIETFIDYWEERYSDDEEEGDEEDDVHPSFDPVLKNER